jgi:hypothetical protein
MSHFQIMLTGEKNLIKVDLNATLMYTFQLNLIKWKLEFAKEIIIVIMFLSKRNDFPSLFC